MKAPIFVFGSGRCGTTLIQRILNSHEQIVIWGEHEGFLGPLARSYRNLVAGPSIGTYVYGPGAPDPRIIVGELLDPHIDISWINGFSPGDVDRRYRELITNLLCADLDLAETHWGFKEIRYGEGHLVLWFLDRLFPTARYVMMHRDPVDTTTSSILAWHENLIDASSAQDSVVLDGQIDTLVTDWYNKNHYLLNYAKEAPQRCHRIRFETLQSERAGEVRRMFDFLGLDAPRLAFELLDSKISDTDQHPALDRVRRRVSESFSQAPDAYRALAEELGHGR